MVAKKDFDIGDLVWAKMKCFPFWPAKIAKPPTDAKSSTPKKAQHYVFFFGSENYAWIQDENIVYHSEEMLQSANKKKSTLLKLAIKQITEEAPKKAKSLVKEKESLKKSPEASTSGTEKKVAKVQRMKMKTESPKVRKKVAPKRRVMDESPNRRSPPLQFSERPTEDYSQSINNAPPNVNHNRIAIIRPLDEQQHRPRPPPSSTTTHTSSAITRRDYFELQPGPTLDLSEPSEAIKAKNVRPSDKKIGFIGLGMMGQRLVKNLLTSNHKVTIWNRTPEKCVEFAKVGAVIAQTPGDVVEKCDIIFCCVSGPEASKSLVFGNCGILSGLERSSPGSKGYVEMTTMDPTTSIEIAEAITHKGGRYLEAPISGSRKMAEDGTLLILGAGDRELFTYCESCFFALSKNAYYLSCDVGSGSKMNLILSMLVGVSHAALAEAMALVERSGLSQTNFLEILELSPLNSPLLTDKGQAMLSRLFTTNSSLKYQQKDLNLALSLGNSVSQPMLITAAANELFKHAKLLRYSDHDVSAVYLGAKY
ncbi:cytokine-like nuclear factor N-PAC isoform X1 [Argiope bruennichi]|uniref:cytokine-like nuclear factor N-PAC isoform X1 n=1 Tax=Argiope bruennichi TaxID=94029 RepID=UPI002493ED98|nr:cytokine-like nuclear factor N-PAC isoform X1 [Argiope bruennichi]XP_055946547.1 cytokine-like nuclear factor N-PAC isoform X1 [Argiope bruennichi]